MAAATELTTIWVEDSLDNAEVIAAHERTMFLHRVAYSGAAVTMEALEGTETRGKTDAIGYGRLVSRGPNREWTWVSWRSNPVHVGETEENDLGLTHEFMTLGMNGRIETRTKRSLMRKAQRSEALIGEDYNVARHLGNRALNPTDLIAHPTLEPVYIDRGYTDRDVIKCINWSPEGQIDDYQIRTDRILAFMAELAVLVGASGVGYDLTRHFRAGHVANQLRKIADVPNQNED